MLDKSNFDNSLYKKLENKLSNNKWHLNFSDKKVFLLSLFFILAIHTIALSQITKTEYSKNQLTRARQNAQKNSDSAVTGANEPILFTTNRNGNNDIYKISADGASVVQLTFSTTSDFGAKWSPTGLQLIYRRNISSGRTLIYRMNSDGTDHRLLSDIVGQHRIIGWSPNGQKIIYTLEDGNGNDQLWSMNSDGSNKTPLTSSNSMFVLSADYSPDGIKIAYDFCDVDFIDCDIFTMNADGTNKVNLTNTTSLFEDSPIWSNDGSKITFTVSDSSGNSSIATNAAIMNSDGTNQQNLTDATPSSPVFFLSGPISPDGSKVASRSFVSSFSTSEEFLNSFEINTVGLDGNNQTMLTNNNVPDFFSAWSPDSSKIVFSSRRDTPTNEIYIMNADGTGVVRLTNTAFTDSATDWQPVPDCFYTISSDYLNIPPAGGTSSFDLSTTSNCSWNATTTSDWITINNASGANDATISFTVAENTGLPRYGSISLNGNTFTILQQENASPQVYSVNKTEDTMDGVCDADCSLREAIIASNETGGDDTINFNTSAFAGIQTITLGGSELRIENAGALTINGPGSELLAIDANNMSRAFLILSDVTATLNGLSILNGNGMGEGGPGGGGINNLGTLTVNNAVVLNCSTTAGGGGIHSTASIDGSISTLNLNNSLIINNSAGFGGGVSNEGGGIMNINNSRIDNNESTGVGGGIDTFFAETVTTISNSTVSGNSAQLGGGINSEGGAFTIESSTLHSNETIGSSTAGAGITNFNGVLLINNSTISGNDSEGDGGGIVNFGVDDLTITNSTIANNSAVGATGGYYDLGGVSLNLRSTIIADNTDDGTAPDVQGAINSLNYNLIENTTGATITGDTTENITGVDPQLSPLADNGGPTLTHALPNTSPAVDKGKLPDTLGINTDQRGETRPSDFPNLPNATGGDGSDIGSFELQNVVVNGITLFDFDGDGKTDVSIFRPGPGQWWYLRSSDLDNRAFSFGTNTDKLVPADFTGDGKTDIAFWRESTGEWFILRSEDSSFYSFPFGVSGDIPAPGDFDGDGIADAAVFRPSNSTWYIQRSSDNGTTIEQFGVPEDKPTVADYDGDGKDDIAIYRPSVSQWWQFRSQDGVIAYQFGTAGDKTVQGDYTGDGKADVAVFRPSTGQWLILRSEDASFYGFPYGLSTDIPSPGDYDGDGTFDAAVFRPSTNTWFYNGSTSGNVQLNFGIAGDVPLPSVYSVE